MEQSLTEQKKSYTLHTIHDFSQFSLSKDLYQKVPYNFVKRQLILPVEEKEDYVLAVSANPLNLEAVEELWFFFHKEIISIHCPQELVAEAINQCYQHTEEISAATLEKISANAEDNLDLKKPEHYDLLDNAEDAPIVKWINYLISEAIRQGASDIHIEPAEKDLLVRFRIDGVLQKRASPPVETHARLIARLKVLSKLDIAERRLPQDGRIQLRLGGKEIDFRVSTVPIVYGERIVLRILDKNNIALGLDTIEMPAEIYAKMKKCISYPEGIILVTGPTGSGKTTTLYSSICEIQNDSLNIMSIEDPVEYNLSGIAQIGVQPKIGLTFASGLRHILRQDPDVILIGEIRDRETAEIAIQAALTGHLVFSTLHTNDAPSALTRLVDMGIEPYLLSSSVIAVLAQRLVRKICSHCKTSCKATAEECASLGLLWDGSTVFYYGKGCNSCFGSGYKGRQGLYEFMTMSSLLKTQTNKSADRTALRELALKEGMASLLNHGAELVLNGSTTLSEVLRVTRGYEV